MARATIREAVTAGTAVQPTTTNPGRLKVQIISPGWGSSGYYPANVLQEAATGKVWPAGTHMYLDHPTESETFDRPERSVRDLAAVTAEDAYWDGTALVAEAKVFAPYRELLTDPDVIEAIGVSIRGTAEGETGEAEGRSGIVFTKLVEGLSVDFVTHAGRGGRVLAVLESAHARRVAEATYEERRDQLSRLVSDAYGGDGRWVYVRDFDDDQQVVWFSLESSDDNGTYVQSYQVTDDTVTALTGNRTEVRQVTTYVPVDPAGQSTTTQESEEDTMPQIEESRLAQLEADAGRVTALESERAQAVQRAEEAERELAEARTAADQATAQAIVAEADYDFNALERLGLLASLPLAENGRLDADAFRTTVTEAAAQAAEAAGAGAVRGVGGTTQVGGDTDLSESDFDAELARISGRTVKEA